MIEHERNCPQRNPMSDDACTCGLEWRIKLGTEQVMHAAWRKRAEEAEKELLQRQCPECARLAKIREQTLDSMLPYREKDRA
jgi:hypothetical protein